MPPGDSRTLGTARFVLGQALTVPYGQRGDRPALSSLSTTRPLPGGSVPGLHQPRSERIARKLSAQPSVSFHSSYCSLLRTRPPGGTGRACERSCLDAHVLGWPRRAVARGCVETWARALAKLQGQALSPPSAAPEPGRDAPGRHGLGKKTRRLPVPRRSGCTARIPAPNWGRGLLWVMSHLTAVLAGTSAKCQAGNSWREAGEHLQCSWPEQCHPALSLRGTPAPMQLLAAFTRLVGPTGPRGHFTTMAPSQKRARVQLGSSTATPLLVSSPRRVPTWAGADSWGLLRAAQHKTS